MDDFLEGGASQSVYHGILKALEAGSVVPGQRLTEAELATQFGVGRNAVREAIQRLAARGVVNLHRNRSASIRQIDIAEADEIFDVAGSMSELLFSLAAARYDAAVHGEELQAALADLKIAHTAGKEFVFSRARRGLYRVIMKIAQNRELARIFPSVGTHILNAKYQSRGLQTMRYRHYQKVVAAITENDSRRAAKLVRKHNEQMRETMRELAILHGQPVDRPARTPLP